MGGARFAEMATDGSVVVDRATARALWWVAGWHRKYATLDGRNDWYVARVFARTLDAGERLKFV